MSGASQTGLGPFFFGTVAAEPAACSRLLPLLGDGHVLLQSLVGNS
jgi:hypothetical protein